MRLKKLILHGFKSFADRTEFVFDTPITCIVGPNGCGKSNIVDAVRWVLGEQSAKSLRGEAMMDVIFNGSEARKPCGMAEVMLVFHNPRKADGTRVLNLDADEVTVGRRLFRDGTSEYVVNGQACRLKDVRELFFDTGIGAEAYSVIEQGRVALLLESDPQQRRAIFEEAAGISKFKAKKKETQRRLERVEQNLLRICDIVEEVDKRLRTVRIQAGRARTYQEHARRLRELRLKHAMREYHGLHQQLKALQQEEAQVRQQLQQVTAELSEKDQALGALRRQHENLLQEKQQCEYQKLETEASAQAARQREEYAAQQLQQVAEQMTRCEAEQADLAGKCAQVDLLLQRQQQELEQLSAEMADRLGRIEQEQQQFHELQLRLDQTNQQIEQHNGAILDLMRRAAAVNNRLGAIEIERRNQQVQQERLLERRRAVAAQLQALESAQADLQQQMQAVQARMENLREQMARSSAEVTDLQRQVEQTSQQLAAAREHRCGLMSRQRLLEDLEARREGISEGVRTVLRQRDERFPFIRGLVADVLHVDVQYAQVIEAALDGRDQMLLAEKRSAVHAAQESLEELEGRVSIICLDELTSEAEGDRDLPAVADQGWPERVCWVATDQAQFSLEASGQEIPGWPCAVGLVVWDELVARKEQTPDTPLPSDPGRGEADTPARHIRRASDLVMVEPELAALARHLLGRTAIVETLAHAEEHRRCAEAGWRYVTMSGTVLEADGTIRIGSAAAATGLICRRSELEALKAQIEDVDRRIGCLTEQVAQHGSQLKALTERQDELRASEYQASTLRVQIAARIAQNQDQQSALSRESAVLEKELANSVEQLGRLRSEHSTLTEQRQSLEAEQLEREQAVECLQADQASLAEQMKQRGELLTGLRVELGQIQEKQLAAREGVQRLEAARAELDEQAARVRQAAEALARRRDAVQADLAGAREQQQRLADRQQQLAQQIAELLLRVEEMSHREGLLAAEVQASRQAQAHAEESLHRLQLQTGELRIRTENLSQRTIEELEIDLPGHYAQLLQQGGYVEEALDWNAVADEIRQLKEKIQRLGNINIDAIAEQEELEQRQQFLSSQVDDLTRSKQQLEQMINEINRESALRFEQTFHAVREHFQAMFRKLFGGGRADLLLQSSEPDIVDQPPAPALDGQTVLPVVRRTVDPLEAGIEIIAKPPGKQPVSISQLSGGEKTMICVALLMSIFKSRPSPFCILDEVDAALDEANIDRFNMIVREFLDQSQFIIITHSKRTMQIADVLYGVTMQEQGVSQRVAVRFDQIDAEGRLTQQAAA